MAMVQKFQIKLSGHWKDYDDKENKMLVQAFMSGFPKAKMKVRGNNYEYDFKKMKQINTESGREIDIRAPSNLKAKAPKAPIVPEGPTICIKVPPGSPGTKIQIPHPKAPGEVIAVDVPAKAKVGAAMLVPVPPVGSAAVSRAPAPAAAPAGGGGMGAGKKAALGVVGVAAVGAAAVGGVVIADAIESGAAEDALADAGDAIADAAADAGDAIADGAADLGAALEDIGGDVADWMGDAADDAGDFIMDLF